MKKLKTILCVLLSSMFLLFAGACMPETYKDTTSNEFIDFEVLAYSTACVGEDSSVKIKYSVTIKKEFLLFSAQTINVEDCIFPIALNDKYDKEYYMEDYKYDTWEGREYRLVSSAKREAFGQAITQIKCEEGSKYGLTTSMKRSYNKADFDKVEKGKYRVYLVIKSLFTESPYVDGEFNTEIQAQNYLIPTDIVLDMQ